MGGLLQRIAGGALEGAGQGLIDENTQAEQMREQALKLAQWYAEQGDITSTQKDASGNVIGITKSGATKPLGINAGNDDNEPVARFQDKDGNWYSQLKNGNVVPLNIQGQNNEPLVPVPDTNSPTGQSYAPRDQASGKPVPAKTLSPGEIIAPILQKEADGVPLTAGEQAALNEYKQMDPVKSAIQAAMSGNGANNGQASSGQSASTTSASPSSQATAKPLPAGMTPKLAVEQAKAAIAQGKPKDQVLDVLRSYGIDPIQYGLK